MKNKFGEKLINRSFIFAKKMIKLVDKFPNKRSSWAISDQLIRASTSIGANIIEAQAASSKKDFINFLNHALKSANETKFWLALSKDILPSSIQKIENLIKETNELANILGSSIIKLKNKF